MRRGFIDAEMLEALILQRAAFRARDVPETLIRALERPINAAMTGFFAQRVASVIFRR